MVTNAPREGILKVAALALLVSVFAASPVDAHHRYDRNAGFTKARTGHRSITVGRSPGPWRDTAVTRPWNQLAGWRLFTINGADKPNVVFRPDMPVDHERDAWVQPIYRRNGSYRRCIIHYKPVTVARFMDLWAFRHELGHCLGFADHVMGDEILQPDSVQCTRPDRPRYSAYRGVMSYCVWWRRDLWFGGEDRRMMRRAGYAD